MRQTTHLAQKEQRGQRGGRARWLKIHACVFASCPTSKLWTMLDKHNQSFGIWISSYFSHSLPSNHHVAFKLWQMCPTCSPRMSQDSYDGSYPSIDDNAYLWLQNSWIPPRTILIPGYHSETTLSVRKVRRLLIIARRGRLPFLPPSQITPIMAFPWQDSSNASRVDLC